MKKPRTLQLLFLASVPWLAVASSCREKVDETVTPAGEGTAAATEASSAPVAVETPPAPVETKAPPVEEPAPLAAAPAMESDGLPAARAVLDRFLEVTRMKDAVAKTSSIHYSGTFAMEAMGMKGATEMWSGKPDKRLVSVEMGAFGTMLVGYDGKTAWSTHPMMGARLLTGTELLQLQLEASYDSVLKPEARYESMRTVGRTTFDGKECFELELVARAPAGMDAASTRAARTTSEFYDIATGYLVGTKGRQEGELGGGPYTQTMSDYRPFGDCFMATRIEMEQSSQVVTMTFDEVEFDTATEETFALPAEIQTMLGAGSEKQAAAPR